MRRTERTKIAKAINKYRKIPLDLLWSYAASEINRIAKKQPPTRRNPTFSGQHHFDPQNHRFALQHRKGALESDRRKDDVAQTLKD